MVGHHMLTLGLMAAAHMFNVQRPGLLILALLNLSSPFMHAAKISNALGSHKALKTGLFLLFAAAFATARCILFPKLLLGLYAEAWQRLWAGQQGVLTPAVLCLSGLSVLQGLQFFWMWKIVRCVLPPPNRACRCHAAISCTIPGCVCLANAVPARSGQ
jgi:hypothetical protein